MLRISTCARACVCGALLLSASLTSLAFAQGNTIQVSGTIKDSSSGVLKDAVVDTVVAGRVTATATSGENGQFRVDAPGGVPFELRVRHEGFADYIAAISGTTTSLTRDVTMQIGTVSDTLVVTASHTLESRRDVTSSVTVATADDMHAVGANQLSEVLRFVPGFAVEGNGREGGLLSAFSRGGESDYNLVLIDGVRVNQQGGLFDFSRIGTGEIDRVEVVRGAQSALWGSDAMGSVVQVFTRRAGANDAPQLSGSVEGGTFNTWRGDARLTGGAHRRIDYSAGVTYRQTDGAFDRHPAAAGLVRAGCV